MKKKLRVMSVVMILTLSFQARIVNSLELDNIKNMELSWISEKPIAHRGLHNKQCPENSISAFKNAVREGYSIEIDVHFTKDKEIVVIHDENLERLTGEKRNIKDTTYYELKKLKLRDSDERIPSLKEVLNIIKGKVPILIEIKTSDNAIELSKEVNKMLQTYKGKYAIQSFNPKVVQWYRKNAPKVPCGILLCKLKDENSLKIYNSIISRELNIPNFISIDLSGVEDERIQQLRNLGYIVISWTIQSKDEESRAHIYSDNFIFESFMPKNK